MPEGKEICKCNIEQEDSTFRAMAVGQSECRQNDCASQKGSLHSQSVHWANEPLLWLVHWRFHLLSPRLSRCGPKLFIILIVLKQHRNYFPSLYVFTKPPPAPPITSSSEWNQELSYSETVCLLGSTFPTRPLSVMLKEQMGNWTAIISCLTRVFLLFDISILLLLFFWQEQKYHT